MTSVHDIPTAHTPAGGYGDAMPAPFLAGCDDALAPDVPDLRGTWRAVATTTAGGDPLPADHPIQAHVERIEQAGARVIVTSGGVVHDMVADGTYEHGVDDVMAADFTTRIHVAAIARHVPRRSGAPGASASSQPARNGAGIASP